jgi:multicomponent Na+:H+ antiporter subunit B
MKGMTKIVKTITSIIFPFTMIFGLYIIVHGHLTPGGGFQGGAVVASSLAMIIVAFGSSWTLKKIREENLSILESIGALSFIILALFGILFGTVFFNNFLIGRNLIFGVIPDFGSSIANINTAGVIPLMNFAVGIKVIVGLFAIVLVMAHATSHRGRKNDL